MKQLLRFGVVGTLGFLTDASVLFVLTHGIKLDALVSRVFSFLLANLVTWYCNRHFTFKHVSKSKKIAEWFRYMSATSIGAMINFSIYTMLVIKGTSVFSLPLVALSIASILALFFNFFSSKYFAFTDKNQA